MGWDVTRIMGMRTMEKSLAKMGMKVYYECECEGKVWGRKYQERIKKIGYEREGRVDRYGWV